MKNIVIILIVMLFGCEKPVKKEISTEKIVKVVKDKTTAIETSQDYTYDVWNGGFKKNPNTHTSYYLIYTDGSYESVDVGKFSISKPGDTIIKMIKSY